MHGETYGEEACEDDGTCYTYTMQWTFEADGDFKNDVNFSFTEYPPQNYLYEGSWEFITKDSVNITIAKLTVTTDGEKEEPEEGVDKMFLKINSISSDKLSGVWYDVSDSQDEEDATHLMELEKVKD